MDHAITNQSVKCSHCAFKALCLPSGLDDASMEQLNSMYRPCYCRQ